MKSKLYRLLRAIAVVVSMVALIVPLADYAFLSKRMPDEIKKHNQEFAIFLVGFGKKGDSIHRTYVFIPTSANTPQIVNIKINSDGSTKIKRSLVIFLIFAALTFYGWFVIIRYLRSLGRSKTGSVTEASP